MYLLDIDILIGLRDARRPGGNPILVAWAEQVPAAHMFISATTLLELERLAAWASRQSKDMGQTWRDWIDRQVQPAFADRCLPIDAAVVRRRAQLPYTNESDGILAATALTHNLTVVTTTPERFRSGRVKALGPTGLEIDQSDDLDWRSATHSGAAWLRNLLIR